MSVAAAAAGRRQPVRAVLFDLDGTLLDTAPDLAWALNRTLEWAGRAPLPFATIRPWVSHGARSLITHGFGIDDAHPDFPRYRGHLLDAYQAHLAVETRLFPGMEALLTALEAADIAWGVVTNKPAYLTDPLMGALGLDRRAACVVSGDTTPHSKPHPEPLLHACRLTGRSCSASLYVGDAARDIEAGLAAGMRTLVALFGYLGTGDDPGAWGAHGLVETPAGILHWIQRETDAVAL